MTRPSRQYTAKERKSEAKKRRIRWAFARLNKLEAQNDELRREVDALQRAEKQRLEVIGKEPNDLLADLPFKEVRAIGKKADYAAVESRILSQIPGHKFTPPADAQHGGSAYDPDFARMSSADMIRWRYEHGLSKEERQRRKTETYAYLYGFRNEPTTVREDCGSRSGRWTYPHQNDFIKRLAFQARRSEPYVGQPSPGAKVNPEPAVHRFWFYTGEARLPQMQWSVLDADDAHYRLLDNLPHKAAINSRECNPCSETPPIELSPRLSDPPKHSMRDASAPRFAMADIVQQSSRSFRPTNAPVSGLPKTDVREFVLKIDTAEASAKLSALAEQAREVKSCLADAAVSCPLEDAEWPFTIPRDLAEWMLEHPVVRVSKRDDAGEVLTVFHDENGALYTFNDFGNDPFEIEWDFHTPFKPIANLSDGVRAHLIAERKERETAIHRQKYQREGWAI